MYSRRAKTAGSCRRREVSAAGSGRLFSIRTSPVSFLRSQDHLLTILNSAERAALYGIPDFDDFQRAEFFALTAAEHRLIRQSIGLPEQMLCHLQLAYFKAKKDFFRFRWDEVPKADIEFLRQRYFPNRAWRPRPIRRAELHAQRRRIVAHFGYRFWSERSHYQLMERAEQAAKRDVSTSFIVTELITWLTQQRIVRPGYTKLQRIVGEALTAERLRLGNRVKFALNEETIKALQQLMARKDGLSELAGIKQDAQDFGYNKMLGERHKRSILEPLYRVAKTLLPTLGTSQQNLNYYASLVDYYSIYDLRRLT